MELKQNPHVRALAPYALADLSVPEGKTLISLAQNELCFSPTAEVIEAAAQAAESAQLYPDPDWTRLTQSIAGIFRLDPARILCGAGSMELLEVLGRVYLSPSDQVVMSEYGYSFFRTVAHMYGADVSVAPEHRFSVDVDEVLHRVRPNTRMVFIANPGNPTGTLIPAEDIRRLRNALDSNVLLILDEAYADFADDDLYPPLFDLVDGGDTVVLRTFSKIHGLAGMRVGWGYFPADVRQAMRKVLNPNNIPLPSQAAATASILQQDVVDTRRRTIERIRQDFCHGLSGLGLRSPDSHANFVLIEFPSESIAQSCFADLRNEGIMMRPMGAYGLTHCLRATLSHDSHMQLALKLLGNSLGT